MGPPPQLIRGASRGCSWTTAYPHTTRYGRVGGGWPSLRAIRCAPSAPSWQVNGPGEGVSPVELAHFATLSFSTRCGLNSSKWFGLVGALIKFYSVYDTTHIVN